MIPESNSYLCDDEIQIIMRLGKILLCVIGIHAVIAARSGTAPENSLTRVRIGGHVGDRIDLCIRERVMKEDADALVEPFRHLTEGRKWQSEFLGKWMLGAVSAYEYNGDPALFSKIQSAAEAFMATQHEDGYIGNYKPEDRLKSWDIWGRKYSTLALLAYWRVSGDVRALDAAGRVIDHLMRELDERGADISATGNYFGMASCSVLEPVVYLYNATGEKRYLDFAEKIAASMEQEGRSGLVRKALAGVPVSRRSEYPKSWWSYDNGMKAYEMMSCYEGLVELGKVNGDSLLFSAAEMTAASIMSDEINIAGSGAAFECWYEGRKNQTLPAYHTMETCVTFTWMQFCARLLALTGNSVYADPFERTMYNALMAAMKDDGSQISKYSPLEGRRTEGEHQCGMDINCCNANGPRAFALIPKVAWQVKGDAVNVNLYLESGADVLMYGRKVSLSMHSSCPVDGNVVVEVTPEKPVRFRLNLRIPQWSGSRLSVQVNGEPVGIVLDGGYLAIDRAWKRGDVVTMDLDIRTVVERSGFHEAVVRGPVVFARDSRFNDGDVDECAVIQTDTEGIVQAVPEYAPAESGMWLTMKVPMVTGTDLEGSGANEPRPVMFCDFGSSGNDWDPSGRYRVWIPKTLNMMKEPYRKY